MRLITVLRGVAVGLVVIVGMLVLPRAAATDQRGETSTGSGIAAKVGDQVITMEELEQSLALPLARLQEQR
ncbi:MAG: hypothetical protein ACREIN_01475, partial [Candidatus Methylomirabilaceae bacterium]